MTRSTHPTVKHTGLCTCTAVGLLTALLLTACSESETRAGETGSEARKLVVYTVNYPLQYFAERIGGDDVEVVFPAPRDEDPAFWRPDADTVARYQVADLILLNGAGYADWIRSATLPMSSMVDTSKGFADRYIAADGVRHRHGPDSEHSHGTTAFTTWLDPSLALEHARAIADALIARQPDRAQAFRDRFEALQRDLRELDSEIRFVVGEPERPLLGSHPVYQYLKRKYELDLESLHWEPDQVPPQQEWDRLETLLEDHPARAMLWESTPVTETMNRLQSLGIESLVFAPCGKVPERGDYLAVMARNVQNLRLALR